MATLDVSSEPINASSKSPYESEYDHGSDDSELKAEDRYINEPGKGASFHTDEFMDGYRTGYQECKEGNSNDSENDDGPSNTGNDCFNEGYNDGRDNPFSLDTVLLSFVIFLFFTELSNVFIKMRSSTNSAQTGVT